MYFALPISNMVITINQLEEVYTVANKYSMTSLGIEVGDKLLIKWLGTLVVKSITRTPYWNAIGEHVEEIIIDCRRE